MSWLLGLAAISVAAITVAKPEVVARSVGAALGFLVGDVLRIRRRHVVRAMQRAQIPEASRVARRMYGSLGRGLVELVTSALSPGRLLGLVTVPVLPGGLTQGAVLATAHTGNWDLVACEVARRRSLTVVTKRLSIRWLDSFWQGIRAKHGLHLVCEGDAAGSAMAALKRGELVAMLVDQVPERHRGIVHGEFLGARVAIDLAPALIAMRARVPLVAAFPYRDASGGHQVEIAGVFEPPVRVCSQWAEAVMKEVTLKLDAFVRRHPEQWLWMHRRWREPRPRPRTAPLVRSGVRTRRLRGYGPGGIRAA